MGSVMTDIATLSERELLELAAEAAGIELKWVYSSDEYINIKNFDPWNSLRFDENAFQLMCALYIQVKFCDETEKVIVSCRIFDKGVPDSEKWVVVEADLAFDNRDSEKVRLAITRCAALVALERRKVKDAIAKAKGEEE